MSYLPLHFHICFCRCLGSCNLKPPRLPQNWSHRTENMPDLSFQCRFKLWNLTTMSFWIGCKYMRTLHYSRNNWFQRSLTFKVHATSTPTAHHKTGTIGLMFDDRKHVPFYPNMLIPFPNCFFYLWKWFFAHMKNPRRLLFYMSLAQLKLASYLGKLWALRLCHSASTCVLMAQFLRNTVFSIWDI